MHVCSADNERRKKNRKNGDSVCWIPLFLLFAFSRSSNFVEAVNSFSPFSYSALSLWVYVFFHRFSYLFSCRNCTSFAVTVSGRCRSVCVFPARHFTSYPRFMFAFKNPYWFVLLLAMSISPSALRMVTSFTPTSHMYVFFSTGQMLLFKWKNCEERTEFIW